jgi:hypothetical protein
VKITSKVLKNLIKEELEGLGPRTGAMDDLPGSTAAQRRYSRRAAEIEADMTTHGMDMNPYQALGDKAIEEIIDGRGHVNDVTSALGKLFNAAETNPDAKAILDAVQSETGLSIGRASMTATMPRPAAGLTPSERDAALMQEAAGSLERLMVDAAKDAIAQGASKTMLGQIMLDIMVKAGVNLDPRRNLLDPKTSDPDTQNVQKMANKASMAKMAKPEPLDDIHGPDRDTYPMRSMGGPNVYESKKGEFGKMKITKSVLKDLIREAIEEIELPDVPGEEDYDPGPYDPKKAKALIRRSNYILKNYSTTNCPGSDPMARGLSGLSLDLRKQSVAARRDKELAKRPARQKQIVSDLRQRANSISKIARACGK